MEINRDNVAQLRVAWVLRTADAPEGSRTGIYTNPLMVNEKLYVASPRSRILALHPATGAVIWSFDPGHSSIVRGLSYWEDGDDRRVLVPVQRYLYALNADDGTLVASFGDGGRVDTRYGLGRDPDSVSINHTSPGVVFEDRIILGSSVGEGYGAAPGHVRAYDVRTGDLVWTFHTIPQPGQFGHGTWPADAHEHVGGVNDWSGMSLDPGRGTVFLGTGSAAFDFYGGDRWGENLFANSVIALDARTGERRWHYQIVRHDLWDWDLPAPPVLATVVRGGKSTDAVAQVTKTGFIYVFDRDTGRSLFPIEERLVPDSDVPGERAWPTQPIPTTPAPFVRQGITEGDLTNLSPEAHDFVLNRVRGLRLGPMFTPPSLRGTLVLPGTWGGAEWSGGAFDPETGILYVNANELPSVMQLVPRRELGEDAHLADQGRNVFVMNGCAACHGADRQGGEAPSLENLGQRLTRGRAEEVIRDGLGGMPAFSHLPGSEMDALVRYLFEGASPDTARSSVMQEARDSRKPSSAAELAERPYRIAGYEKLRDQFERPGIEPPWGTLTAVNLNDGAHAWQIPLGEYPGVAEEFQPTGTPNFGGAIVTKGGLVFIGATMDEKFRAIDKTTGRILWEHKLPAGGYATPATYEFEGKQYVVIAAGGGGKPATPSSDTYVAFALP